MVRFERFTDDVVTTLSGSINDTVTSISVADGSGYPADGDFRLHINTETVRVTARSGNTLTVIRGTDGTTATSHTSGDDVRLVATKDSIQSVVNQIYAGGAEHPPHAIQDLDGSPLTASSFSLWTNQGGSSIADTTWGGVKLSIPANANSTNLRLVMRTAPSPPWNLVCHLCVAPGPWQTSGFDFGGIALRESSTGKIFIGRLTWRVNGAILWQYFTSVTSSATTVGTTSWLHRNPFVWLRLEDDNAGNLTFKTSADGTNFYTAGTTPVTTPFTTAYDEIGFFGNGASSGGFNMLASSFVFVP